MSFGQARKRMSDDTDAKVGDYILISGGFQEDRLHKITGETAKQWRCASFNVWKDGRLISPGRFGPWRWRKATDDDFLLARARIAKRKLRSFTVTVENLDEVEALLKKYERGDE